MSYAVCGALSFVQTCNRYRDPLDVLRAILLSLALLHLLEGHRLKSMKQGHRLGSIKCNGLFIFTQTCCVSVKQGAYRFPSTHAIKCISLRGVLDQLTYKVYLVLGHSGVPYAGRVLLKAFSFKPTSRVCTPFVGRPIVTQYPSSKN
jgi:hypothetical protein